MTSREISTPPATPRTTPPATCSPPVPLRSGIATDWMLDPAITFLNHGCFGARPRVVVEAQERWLRRYHARPIELLDRNRNELLTEAKRPVGELLGMKPENFGFVTNATEGVNAVLRSLSFRPGDELLTPSHVYNAVRNTMRHLIERAGGTYVEAPTPFPVTSPDELVNVIAEALNDRTRLVLIDHIASPTGVLFPVERIITLCREKGVDVFIDGAHAPGMIALDVESLGAAYYTGNLHKWICAPSGAAFLWVSPEKQRGIHPPTISHFLDEGLAAEFAWQGTRDITPWLCVKDAIDYLAALGWEDVLHHNHQMAMWVQQMLSEKWGVGPSTPLDGSMIGSLVSFPFPGDVSRFDDPVQLHDYLYDEHHIEIPIFDFGGQWLIRTSSQVYNTPDQYERLGEVVLDLMK